MSWSREDFERDKRRYSASLDDMLDAGLPEDHPFVRRLRRRIATVEYILGIPDCALIKEAPDGNPEPA